jgi:predicted MFS family arabinose efflux permease
MRDQTEPSSLWHNRSYMLLWGGQVVSTLGSISAGIIYPLLILALTDSPEIAGYVSALRALPYLIFSLPVGALIDRWNRKRVMILCDIGRGIAVASLPIAILFDAITVVQIGIVAFVEGTLFVFFNVAEVATLPRVVPKAQLPQATAQNEAAFGAAVVAGPSFGTFLFHALGQAVPFIADAISYVVSAISLSLIRTPFHGERSAERRHLLVEIMEGLRWLMNQPLIRYMAALTGGLNFVNASGQLLLIVLATNLGASTTEIGLIFSIGGVGGIIGSLIGGRLQRRFSFGQIIIAAVWVQALLIPLYAVLPSFWMLGVTSALVFAVGPIYNVVQFSYRVALIPDELQGRVNSTFRLLAFGLNPLGAALCGVLIERIGAKYTVAFFGACMVVLAIVTTLNRHVRNAGPIEHASLGS